MSHRLEYREAASPKATLTRFVLLLQFTGLHRLFTVFSICAICGFVLGRLAAGWSASMLYDMNHGGLMACTKCQYPVGRFRRWLAVPSVKCSQCRRRQWWPLGSAIGLSTLFVVYAFCLLDPLVLGQNVDEVQPGGPLEWDRLPFHLSLIFLLWTATVTDFLDYMIPDEIIYPGIAIALVAATWSGELQMIHIWVNWGEPSIGPNGEFRPVELYGPYLPNWLSNHQHWHGLAWSLAGLLTGGIVTWLVRLLAGKILGAPALGGGDVTLMAMIGAYIGWQPTLCVLALAPLAGVVLGLACRLVTGRSFVAFGPYLAFSTYIVLISWRFLWADWLSLRDIFSHWPTVVGMVSGAIVGMCLLLGLIRIFRSLPTDRLSRR